jgi:Ca2+/H+ antiporter
MLPLSVLTIVAGYAMGQAFVTRYAVGVFIIGLLSIIPLGYATQKAATSFSAQTSIGLGALINSTFSSMVDIILYTLALQQELSTVVLASFTGILSIPLIITFHRSFICNFTLNAGYMYDHWRCKT